jgi:hypothetical protein
MEIKYRNPNRSQQEQTASASKYPQGYFKSKPCKHCSTTFTPNAPSHKYCSQYCADYGITSAYLVRTYGITYEEYNAMLVQQKELCAICNKEGFLMDKERHKTKLVVDHCHVTGVVRGLLCHNCNRALGLLKDDLVTINNAMEYLKVQRLTRKGVELSGSKRITPSN